MCGGVQEVLLVEWNLDHLVREVGFKKPWERYMLVAGYGDHNQRGRELELEECEEGRRWGWVDCDEADVVKGNGWPPIRADYGPHCESLLQEFKKRGVEGKKFFEYMSRNFEEELELAGLRARKHDEDKASFRKVPKVKIVHVGTMGKMKMLFEMRRRYGEALEKSELKELESGMAFVEDPDRTRPSNMRFSVQPSKTDRFSQAWKDDIEVLNEQDYNP
jgi:hypothetical protein